MRKKYILTGRVFDYDDFNYVDLNLFGGPHAGWLKDGETIRMVDDEGRLAEVIELAASVGLWPWSEQE